MEKSEVGRVVIAKKYRAQSLPKKMGDGFIPLVSTVLPQDTGTFNMGEEDRDNRVTLAHYCLHQYCVTNVEYEQFDPRHQERSWWGREPHPAATAVKARARKAADNDCPAVMVTWYDAWCFAKYLGTVVMKNGKHCKEYEVVLPSEVQWEYACRAGRRTRFTFDEAHSGTSCTPEYCNFDGNYPDEGEAKGEYRACTLPVDGQIPASWKPLQITSVQGRNRWGFYQMHGNVWEWCVDWFDQEASARVLRGGSWDGNGGGCRSAYRSMNGPDSRDLYCGFRLAAVPVGAKPGQASEA